MIYFIIINKLKYPGFFTTFQFALSLKIIFVKAWFFHVNLHFQKEKTSRKRVYSQAAICVYSACLKLLSKLPFTRADFAWDKNITFDYSDACLFGNLFFFFYYHDFLGFAYHSKVLIQESYEKCCNWIKSQHILRPYNLTFLISFVLLLSPK